MSEAAACVCAEINTRHCPAHGQGETTVVTHSFNRPDVEAPLIVWEYALTLERLLISAEERLAEAQDELDRLRSRRLLRGACSIEGCDRLHQARGWCHLHYQRWLRHGDPLALRRRRLRKIVHGTVSGYINRRCRCDECRSAMSAYNREHLIVSCRECGAPVWKDRGRPRATGLCTKCLGIARRTAKHGTESRYNRGCRCRLCKDAVAAARRRRRRASGLRTTSAPSDASAMNHSVTRD